MPRDAGGIYFLPSGNPVIPGTVIESDWANPTMSDIGQEVSDSLSRSGKGGMLAALRGLDGSAAQPTFSFTNEPSTGRYRDGPGQVVEAVAGIPVVRYLSSGLEQWDQSINGGVGGWVPLTPRDALGTPFDPAPSTLTSTNVQDAIEEVNNKSGGQITADSVLYDDTLVYFPAATVQLAIDRLGIDVAGLANDILDNTDSIFIIGGDLILLEQRVAITEVDIGQNTTAILLLDTLVQDNTLIIDQHSVEINNIKFEQIEQNDRLTGAEDWTQFNWGQIQLNTADITTNINNIAINAANIASNLSQINSNTGDITTLWGQVSTNVTNIGNNSTSITSNTGRISVNEGNIATIGGWFPGNVLSVINGGTGVTTQSGTGAGVHTTGPELWSTNVYSGELWTDVLCVTQSVGSYSRRLASTAFVHDVVDTIGGTAQDITTGDTANGRYAAVYSGTGTWRVFCWSQGTWANSGTADQLPVTHQSGSVQMSAMYNSAGVQSFTPSASNIGASAFTGWGAGGIGVRWTSMGEATYTAAYKNVVPTDRYYNKVTRTEHLEIMHGDWTADPDVVILPPGNTFWGPPLALDEVLSFDVDNLPLARVPRVISQEEAISVALRAAGVTRAAMDRALYLAGRGVTGPLTTIDNELDALVVSETVTLETLVELI